MKAPLPIPFDGSSSAPADATFNSGNGSIMASIVARGIAISRYTPQGSMRPFGQDTGTAGDNTVVEHGDVTFTKCGAVSIHGPVVAALHWRDSCANRSNSAL
jgi:hypothetical protein